MGVVLNQPIRTTVTALSGRVFEEGFEWDKQLHLGGPVPGSLTVLHALGDLADGRSSPASTTPPTAAKVQEIIRRRPSPPWSSPTLPPGGRANWRANSAPAPGSPCPPESSTSSGKEGRISGRPCFRRSAPGGCPRSSGLRVVPSTQVGIERVEGPPPGSEADRQVGFSADRRGTLMPDHDPTPPAISVIIPTLNEEPGSGPSSTPSAACRATSRSSSWTAAARTGRWRSPGAEGQSSWPPSGGGAPDACRSLAARGEVLWFLHADTIPPADAARRIHEALADPQVVGGNFELVLSGDSRPARFLTWLYPKLRWLGLAYGDSAFFVRRSAYETIGGFRPHPDLRGPGPAAAAAADRPVRPHPQPRGHLVPQLRGPPFPAGLRPLGPPASALLAGGLAHEAGPPRCEVAGAGTTPEHMIPTLDRLIPGCGKTLRSSRAIHLPRWPGPSPPQGGRGPYGPPARTPLRRRPWSSAHRRRSCCRGRRRPGAGCRRHTSPFVLLSVPSSGPPRRPARPWRTPSSSTAASRGCAPGSRRSTGRLRHRSVPGTGNRGPRDFRWSHRRALFSPQINSTSVSPRSWRRMTPCPDAISETRR